MIVITAGRYGLEMPAQTGLQQSIGPVWQMPATGFEGMNFFLLGRRQS